MNNPEPIPKTYFRSMGIEEYKKWKIMSIIPPRQEWTNPEILCYKGYPLIELQRWVDEGKSDLGPHDVILSVRSQSIFEFSLATINDCVDLQADPLDYRKDNGHDLMKPYRFMNRKPIEFDRTLVRYDPRGFTAEKPILDLEDAMRESDCLYSFFSRFHRK